MKRGRGKSQASKRVKEALQEVVEQAAPEDYSTVILSCTTKEELLRLIAQLQPNPNNESAGPPPSVSSKDPILALEKDAPLTCSQCLRTFKRARDPGPCATC
ncbi:hypothetical protein Pmar_PMAR010990, partial [Perkinsus marinus ATCC 50983]